MINDTKNLASSPSYDRPTSNATLLKIFGLFTILFMFFGLGGWAGTAPLSRSISAPANFEVQGKRKKVQHLENLGIRVIKRIPIKITPNKHNKKYLDTKSNKSGHLI